jgi:glycosyltransferase involved in cell wall biosynthesis
MKPAPYPMKRHRVLVVAEAANPEWASVPLEGWSLSQALRKVADIHLVTHIRNRDAIQRAGLTEGRDFSTINNERFAAPLYAVSERLRGGSGKGWTTVTAFSALAYYSFELELWRQFRHRLFNREFDLVHRVTPLSPTHQSTLAKRLAQIGIPFVVGPLNGGVPWPKHFIDRQHAEREWLSHIRILYKLMPAYRSMRKYSAAIIAGSKHTYSEIPQWASSKRVYIPENGVDPERFSEPRRRTAKLPLRGAFVGRLVPYKGADILIQAASEFIRAEQMELHIVGDGPERRALEVLSSQLGIGAKVTFHGWVPHQEVQILLRDCDMMLLPSVREFGGAVAIESMALGVPPIVANYGGPSELVDDDSGLRIDFSDKESLTEGFRCAISRMIKNPSDLDRLGLAGMDRVRNKFTWQRKAEQITRVYDAVLRGDTDFQLLDVS